LPAAATDVYGRWETPKHNDDMKSTLFQKRSSLTVDIPFQLSVGVKNPVQSLHFADSQ
jgi:hypothetical protein